MKKQFKIGEYAIGGIIAIEEKNDVVKIEALDYVSKNPVMSDVFNLNMRDSLNQIDNFLNELTTSYYADKILNYIKTKAIK
jgi:hypothetical protein